MADPSVRLSNTGTATPGTNLAIAITGTPLNGELILYTLIWNESPAFSTPTIAGFSVIASITTADFNPLYIFGKLASNEGTNPTYTAVLAGGAEDGYVTGYVTVWQDTKNAGLPTNTASTHDTSASTTFSIPALTTAVNGSVDFAAVTQDGNVESGSSRYSSWGSSLVELADIAPASPNGYPALGVAAVARATAGVQAATTVTSGNNDKNVALRIEIEPPTAGFPQVLEFDDAKFLTPAQSYAVPMPSTVDAGDLLLMFVIHDADDAVSFDAVSEWTNLVDADAASGARCGLWYKVADGDEDGTTVTVSFSGTADREAIALVYRIAEGTFQGTPEAASAEGTSVNPNPPSLSPSWGSDNNLFLVFLGNDQDRNVTAYPANYTGGRINSIISGQTGDCTASACMRQLAAASDDPGTFTLDFSEQYRAVTVAVRGGTAAPAAGKPHYYYAQQ